jgi:hypothetical protein
VKEQAETEPLGRSRCRWEDKVKICSRSVMSAWDGLIWLRIETVDGRLLQGVFFFLLIEDLLVSEEGI